MRFVIATGLMLFTLVAAAAPVLLDPHGMTLAIILWGVLAILTIWLAGSGTGKDAS